ncbi:Piwi domain-containing protein [Schizophyllum commune]
MPPRGDRGRGSGNPARGGSGGGGGGGGRGGGRGGGSGGGGPGRGGGGGGGGGRGGGGWGRGGPRGGAPPGSPTPSSAPSVSSAGGGRGSRGGGGPAIRGMGRGRGRGQTTVLASQAATTIDSSVVAVGVKRPSFGTSGKIMRAVVNMYRLEIPDGTIYHYDDLISEKTLPIRRNMELFKQLQNEIAPTVFTDKVSYDGRKNFYASYRLNIPDDAAEFQIPIPSGNPDRPPRVYRIKIKLVNQINPELLLRFVEGKQSNDNEAITAIQALNVVLRMEPTQKYPFNVRSFYTPQGKREIRGGIELWRGYFQSVRPTMHKLVVNVDVTAAVFYQPGPLISLCLKFFNRDPSNPSYLERLQDRERLELKRWLTGLKVYAGDGGGGGNGGRRPPRAITGLSRDSAMTLSFRLRREGQPERSITVAQYFQTILNRRLQYPKLPCVEVGSGGAMLPLEICTVPEGQQMRKAIPKDATRDMVEFSAQRPDARFNAIHGALQLLSYGQSEYVRKFGMSVSNQMLEVNTRVLPAPIMQYGPGSRQKTVPVRNGAWNMADKHFYVPMPLDSWAIMCLEGERFFPQGALDYTVAGLKDAASKCGSYRPAQRGAYALLNELLTELRNKGLAVKMIVVILPMNGDQIWEHTKYWGDIDKGVATQCLKADKCKKANIQYWANVCLKINGKLGGINAIADPQSAAVLSDPHHSTLVLGADVIHPSPGSVGRPSFAAMVGNVDRNAAKYIATSRAQRSRQEYITDFGNMAKEIITSYASYRQAKEGKTGAAALPSRIIVYRDGVSEPQFPHIKEQELPLLQEACTELGIKPQITFIRHHMRLLPKNPGDADRSGNMPAGTVVDADITHPVEFDFYLQSHAGLKGTSRSGHYSDYGFNADTLQYFTYILCHVYARATRSVSIPAPTYYADIVCSRAKTHYNPGVDMSAASETASTTAGQAAEQNLANQFRQVHPTQKSRMYFQ